MTGARQVGKSTILTQEKPFLNWRYSSLDDFDILGKAEHEPTDLWGGADHIVIDEVQKSPSLLSAIKREVDKRQRKMRFVLSGSANLLLMQKVSESLAGHAVYFTLHPMTLGEIEETPSELLLRLFEGKFPSEGKVSGSSKAAVHWMLRGFMPPLLEMTSTDACIRWWEGYVATYLERDLRQMSQVDSLSDFKRVMEILALRSGSLLNQTEVSRDAKISQPTIHRYINLLEASCLLTRLPAFSRSRTKRLVKSPKAYWMDSGLASFLAGHHDEKALAASREAGSIFETMIFLHLAAFSQTVVPKPRLYYWRTVSGKEIDFVVEHGKKLVAIEAKMSNTVRLTDVEPLKLFLNEHKEAVAGVLVYSGNEIKRLDGRIVAVPWYLLG